MCPRRFRPVDLTSLHNDADVMRWINGGEATPLSVARDTTLPTFMRTPAPSRGYWLAEYPHGSFAGWFSLRQETDGARLGYRLAQAAWGQGLGTEGAQALLGIAFNTPDLNRVSTTTYEKNTGSQRVLDKLGFKPVRRFRLTVDVIEASETAPTTSAEVWDGDELEYVLERRTWARDVANGI